MHPVLQRSKEAYAYTLFGTERDQKEVAESITQLNALFDHSPYMIRMWETHRGVQRPAHERSIELRVDVYERCTEDPAILWPLGYVTHDDRPDLDWHGKKDPVWKAYYYEVNGKHMFDCSDGIVNHDIITTEQSYQKNLVSAVCYIIAIQNVSDFAGEYHERSLRTKSGTEPA